MKKKMNRRAAGFTLIEIMLVVVIIGFLAGIAIKSTGGHSKKAMITQAQGSIDALYGACAQFEIINGYYPKTLDELLDEKKGGPFMQKKKIPMDPWGNPFKYVSPGVNNTHNVDLSCESPDGGISVNNWE